jgi:hypothetical protein
VRAGRRPTSRTFAGWRPGLSLSKIGGLEAPTARATTPTARTHPSADQRADQAVAGEPSPAPRQLRPADRSVDHHLRRSRRADRHPRGLRLTDLPLWQQIDAAHLPDMTLAVLSSLPGAGLYSGGLTAVPARAPQARPRPRYQRPGPARLGTRATAHFCATSVRWPPNPPRPPPARPARARAAEQRRSGSLPSPYTQRRKRPARMASSCRAPVRVVDGVPRLRRGGRRADHPRAAVSHRIG